MSAAASCGVEEEGLQGGDDEVEEESEAAAAAEQVGGQGVGGPGHEEEEEEEEECAVCLVPLQGGQGAAEEGWGVCVLQCGHSFHDECVDAWASLCARKRLEPTCPACRAPLVRV